MHLTFSVNAAIQKGKGLDLEVDPQTLLSLDTPPPPSPGERSDPIVTKHCLNKQSHQSGHLRSWREPYCSTILQAHS